MTALLSFALGNWRIIGLTLAGVAVGIWHANETRKAYNRGAADTRAAITAANDAARGKADTIEDAIRNCLGTWNRETQKCAQ